MTTGPQRTTGPDALALHHILKRFGGVVALDGADLVVRRGTVHALLGENGAGKTTLMRVAYGMVRPDGGTVSIEGIDRTFRSSADAIRAGVGMVHQHYALVPAMTVAENVALGGRGTYDARATVARVRALTEETGLALDPDARVEDLSVEAQQRVEIVKALARDARILILDEPTAVLPPTMAVDLLTWLRRFADGGRSVVLITHRLREALRIADDITVLRHGRTVLTVPAPSASTDDLANVMLGTDGTKGQGSGVRGLVTTPTAGDGPSLAPQFVEALLPGALSGHREDSPTTSTRGHQRLPREDRQRSRRDGDCRCVVHHRRRRNRWRGGTGGPGSARAPPRDRGAPPGGHWPARHSGQRRAHPRGPPARWIDPRLPAL